MKCTKLIAALGLSLLLNSFYAQRMLKGIIVEQDSSTAMPFVYIINKSNGNGTMTDNDGKFMLSSNLNDTLICSYIGYSKVYLPVNRLISNANGEVKIVMGKQFINLNTVTVTSFKVKTYEREYMKSIIDRSKIKTLDYATSPISALYMQFSNEGKQIRKLAKIFEELFVEEQVQKKLSPDLLRKLTGDDTIDYYAFRKYCYNVSDNFIITHDGVELYSKIMECYKRWKNEKGKGYNSDNNGYKEFNHEGYKSRNND